MPSRAAEAPMSAGRSWARHWARRSATARAVSPRSSDKVRSAPGRIQQPSWRVFGGAPGPPRTWSRLVTTQLEQVFPQRSRICQKKNGSELVSHITNSHYHEGDVDMEGYPYTACVQKLHNHGPANYKQWEYSAWDILRQRHPTSKFAPMAIHHSPMQRSAAPHVLGLKNRKMKLHLFWSSHPSTEFITSTFKELWPPLPLPLPSLEVTFNTSSTMAPGAPARAAKCKALCFSCVTISSFARAESNKPTTSSSQRWEIICKICRRQKRKHDKNVSPVSLINYNYDIRLASRDDCAAKWIGCTPFLSGQVAGALAASNNFTTSTWPFMHAAWSGVRVPVLPCKTVGIFKKALTRAIAPSPAPCCRISISVSSSNVSRSSVSSGSWKKLSR